MQAVVTPLPSEKATQESAELLAEREAKSQHAPKTVIAATGAVVSAILIALYPFFIYFGLTYAKLSAVAVVVIIVSIARLILYRRRASVLGASAVWISTGGILLGGAMLLRGSPDAMLLYPVFVNVVLLTVFVYSLVFPPAVITRLARSHDPNLSDSGVRYTRNVTLVWSVFFSLNGLVALYTALWATIEIWTLYNGFVTYVLMGVLMAGEWLVRARIMATEVQSS